LSRDMCHMTLIFIITAKSHHRIPFLLYFILLYLSLCCIVA